MTDQYIKRSLASAPRSRPTWGITGPISCKAARPATSTTTDGTEATRRLHALMGASACPPIVAVTAYSMAQDQQRCLEVGMKSVLTKPLQPADLLRVVDEMVG